MWYGYGWGGWIWAWWVIGIIILILIIWSFAGWGGGRVRIPENGAEQILKQRYANGDISREEYREKLKEIRSR